MSAAPLSLELGAAIGNIGRVGAKFAKRVALISRVLYHILNYYIRFAPLHHLDRNLKHYSGAEMDCAFSMTRHGHAESTH